MSWITITLWIPTFTRYVCIRQKLGGYKAWDILFVVLIGANAVKQIIVSGERFAVKSMQCHLLVQVLSSVLSFAFSFVKSNRGGRGVFVVVLFFTYPTGFYHIFMPQVLIRRTGIPISLSVLYLTIARQLGVKLEPVNFPSHFLLRWCQGKEG